MEPDISARVQQFVSLPVDRRRYIVVAEATDSRRTEEPRVRNAWLLWIPAAAVAALAADLWLEER